MADISGTPVRSARGHVPPQQALRWVFLAAAIFGAWALLSGCDQTAEAQTLPVMDASSPAADPDSLAPTLDAGVQDNTLPNLGVSDVGPSDFEIPDIAEPEIELPNTNPPPTGSPNLGPPVLDNTNSGEPTQEVPESQNTPPPPAPAPTNSPGEDPDLEMRRAPTRGSGRSSPPDFMIRRHPKHT